MDPVTVVQWCEAEGARSEASMAIELPGKAWEEEQVSQVLKALSADRKAWVIAVRPDPGTSHTYALLEWRKGVPESFKGKSVQLGNITKFYIVHPKISDEGPISAILVELDRGMVPSVAPLAMIGLELLAALEDFVSKCQMSNSVCVEPWYRRLRIFSGKQPVPTGEKEFDVWIEQAMQALEEWDLPEAQKKQRISESLRGAAAEAVRNLRLSNTTCTAYDYLAMLQEEFGRLEKAADLIYQFEHTLQRQGERLSEYIRRLNKMLYQIVLKRDDALCHRSSQNTANLKGGSTF
ncbi:modulator of apoptosis 1-like [Aquarana catesbeiana]|uniref:modulator of apoptosis 1-like n=1 Tax=Aquarana catesbeiana TaxID=8400 RepID=UPI003CC95BC3